MVNEEPKASDFGRYSVSETCGLLGIHRNTLLKWTNEGKVRCGYCQSIIRGRENIDEGF